jgi:NDP-sugar pyrophosphorylase family protein
MPISARLHVVLLGGGDATRLRPLSNGWPKPLFAVCGMSVLELQIRQLKEAGIGIATLCMPVASKSVQEAISRATVDGFSLHQVSTGERLSQVEAVRRATPGNCESVLVIYGDSLLSVDFGVLLRRHNEFVATGAMATLLVHRPEDLRQANKEGRTYHGVMALDGDVVTRFVEKPLISEIDWEQPFANAAVFALQSDFLRSEWLSAAANFSYDVFEPAVNQFPGALRAVSIGSGYRFDVGCISRLYELNMRALHGDFAFPIRGTSVSAECYFGDDVEHENPRLTPPVFVARGSRIGANVSLGPDAIIGEHVVLEDDVSVSRSVVHDNTKIGEGTVVSRCIIGHDCCIARKSMLPEYTVLGSNCTIGGSDWPT